MPLAMLFGSHSVADVLVLLGASAVVVITGIPLARHFWNTPSNAPAHLPHRTGEEEAVAAAIDRYSTRWGGGYAAREDSGQ